MTVELEKLRESLVFDSFEWTITYNYSQDRMDGIMSLFIKRKGASRCRIDIGCPSECDIVDILKQASPFISAEPVGTLMDIYGYRLLWRGETIQSLEYDLSEGKFKSIVVAPKTISNFE